MSPDDMSPTPTPPIMACLTAFLFTLSHCLFSLERGEEFCFVLSCLFVMSLPKNSAGEGTERAFAIAVGRSRGRAQQGGSGERLGGRQV